MATKKARLGRSLCLVLRAEPYGEADLVLSLFSKEEGLITARAYGARSVKSRIRAACQPFCLAEFIFYLHGPRRSVKEVSVRTEMMGIPNHYEAFLCACVILQLTERILRYADEYEALFRLTVSSLLALNARPEVPERILLFFLLRLIHLSGIFPALSTCACCGRTLSSVRKWSHAEGGAICEACAATLAVENLDTNVLSCLRHFGRGQIGEVLKDETVPEQIHATIALLFSYLDAQYGIRLPAARRLPFLKKRI